MKYFIWELKGDPKDVKIIDKDGVERHPDLDKVKKHARLQPGLVAGRRFGFGVGTLFYGGPLGKKAELEAKGNKYTTNDTILEAIGYVKAPQKNPPKEDSDE